VTALVPGWLLAAETRKAIERHTRWDTPHEFLTLHWEDRQLRPGLLGVIMPDIEPGDYPSVMAGWAAKQIGDDPLNQPVAYLLRVEGHGLAEPGPDASAAERTRYDAARRGRTFHAQPGAVETCTAWCADIDGRLWAASKVRGEPAGQLHQRMYLPGDPAMLGGQIIDALRQLAAATVESRRGRGARS
jgi:hypothetical protein